MADEYFSVNRYPGDGVTTQHELTFAGGYISKAHVKAYTLNAAGVKTDITVTDAMFVGPYTLDLGVAAPVGGETVIYRDTPKGQPLVDFQKGARITEANLDKTTQQAVFGVAEIYDAASAAGVVVADVVTAATAAASARDAAQAYQAAAAASATSASGSSASAAASATNAASSATSASASAAAASGSASNAATSATNASTSATNAAASAAASANSATQAAASAASVNDANLVHKTGNETITGTKTFSSPIVGSTDSQVSLTGDQTITGIKTFSSPIVGSTNSQVSLTGDQSIAGIKTFTSPIVSSGTGLTSIPAGALIGDVAPARLGTGTPDATTFLRGDRTWQPLTNSYIGGRGQVFTASGTFTVPDGVTAAKVRLCGGGSGGGVGAVAGGTTSFGAYCSATGGNGITPGAGNGGDINLTGGRGATVVSAGTSPGSGGTCGGGAGAVGGPRSLGILGGECGDGGTGSFQAASGYGNGGGVTGDNLGSRNSGSAGGYSEKYITGLTPGAVITVTVGAAGPAGTDGKAGSPGIVIVEW